jgi:hypothetical protein
MATIHSNQKKLQMTIKTLAGIMQLSVSANELLSHMLEVCNTGGVCVISREFRENFLEQYHYSKQSYYTSLQMLTEAHLIQKVNSSEILINASMISIQHA